MEPDVTDADDLYLPDTALLRSFIGLKGTVEQRVPSDTTDEEAEVALADAVTISAEDGNLSDVHLREREEGGDDDRVVGEWNATISIPHPQSWNIDDIEAEARGRVDADGGCIDRSEYGYSRPAHEYASDGWRQIGRESEFGSDDDTVIDQWVHEELLVVVGLVEMEVEGDAPVYAVVQLAPPVPSPYDLARYWAYGQRSVAETDMKRYMVSIDGAAEAGVDSPVQTAREEYDFHGSVMDPLDPSEAAVEEREDVEKDAMASLPNRPLTREEVDTVLNSYRSLTDGECRLLLPEEPLFVDEIVKKAQHVTEGDCVAFTITTPDGFVVFELEEVSEGLRWFRAEGELDA